MFSTYYSSQIAKMVNEARAKEAAAYNQVKEQESIQNKPAAHKLSITEAFKRLKLKISSTSA